MGKQDFRIGLMGCGVVADYGHVPAIQAAPGLTLAALFDPNPDAAEGMQTKYGVPAAFTDAEAFFASDIDAVSITSPAPCHLENVLAAAGRGLPVICEKPLAMDRGEAETMAAAMAQAGVPLHCAFCYRFSPCALQVRDLVAQGAIGAVRSLRLIYNWHCHGKFDADGMTVNRRREGRMLEGGPMVDCGTHQIDLAHFWLRSPVVQFSGHGAWVDEYEAPDHVWLHMDHDNGAHSLVEMSYSYHHTTKTPRAEFVYELIGSGGVIRYDRTAGTFTVSDGDGCRELEFHHEKSFAGMYAEWARALNRGDSELLTGAEEATRVVEIARTATDQAVAARRLQR